MPSHVHWSGFWLCNKPPRHVRGSPAALSFSQQAHRTALPQAALSSRPQAGAGLSVALGCAVRAGCTAAQKAKLVPSPDSAPAGASPARGSWRSDRQACGCRSPGREEAGMGLAKQPPQRTTKSVGGNRQLKPSRRAQRPRCECSKANALRAHRGPGAELSTLGSRGLPDHSSWMSSVTALDTACGRRVELGVSWNSGQTEVSTTYKGI